MKKFEMKKVVGLLLAIAFILTAFTGCASNETEQPLAVYSFSGENEQFALNNGVVASNIDGCIFNGGELIAKDLVLTDVSKYNTRFFKYVNGEQETIQSGSCEYADGTQDKTLHKCLGFTGSGQTEANSGKKLYMDISDLKDNLYFELKLFDAEGDSKGEYQLQLDVKVIRETAVQSEE